MFKFAKITLLALAAFLVLGLSITANAAKPDFPPTVDVLVTNSVPLGALRPISSYAGHYEGISYYNALPPGYLHSFSLTVTASNTSDICVAQAAIQYNDGTSDREIPIAAVIATGNTASVSHDYSVPITLLEYAGTVRLKYDIIVGGGNVDWCYIAWGGIYEDLQQ